MLRIQFSVESHRLLPQRGKLLVGLMTHLLLLGYEPLLVGDLLSQVEVNLVINTGLLSQGSQLAGGLCDFSLSDCDLVNEFNLLILCNLVF